MTKRHLESRISSLFGGRLAERMTFGPEAVTTGASNDIKQATPIARDMVTRFSLSDGLGPLAYSEGDEGRPDAPTGNGEERTGIGRRGDGPVVGGPLGEH